MSEYSGVEQPFLARLHLLGWQVIDQGGGIPQDPARSMRTSFKEVILPQAFRDAVRAVNTTPDGRPWLTDRQLDAVARELDAATTGKALHEANKAMYELLLKGTRTDENTITGEKNPLVRMVDFREPLRNSFIAINQFRILTPGGPREGIIPDIVLFVNGLPWVVVECKAEDVADPLSEAFIQISRYANTRDDDYGFREGEERLFHYNLISILTHGREARAGTISAEFDFYNNWMDIFPEEYRTVQVSPDEQRQEVLICGMLNRAILIDLFKHYTLYMMAGPAEVKVVARYNQYRAVCKMTHGLREGEGRARGGVVWHTQGSGKSLTMVFLIKKIRSDEQLRDFKIVMVVDRIDLEKQLGDTAVLSGETPRKIDRRSDLQELADDTGDLSMVMIHKFLDERAVSAQSLIDSGVVPVFKPFEPINQSDCILLLIDEAHRTQGGDMGDNLFTAFPNAVRIGFTGTPLLTERHTQKTHERFGDFIDFYKFDTAVADRATVEIKYLGKTSKDELREREEFDAAFEDMFRTRSEEEKLEIQRRYGSFTAFMESKDRIAKIATDIVAHYYDNILENGFKAQVVATSIIAAVRYKYEIERAIDAKIEQQETLSERDEDKLERLRFLKVAAIVSKSDNNEAAYISAARRDARELNAVENFKKDYDLSKDEHGQYAKPQTGLGIICVCDRLLTGFDAPIEQVMYLDKLLREHDLFQAITRVNRTKQGKKYGLVVDYFGVTKHLKDALAIYTDRDKEELALLLESSFRDIDKEVPVLESRYKRIVTLFAETGLARMDDFLQQRVESDDWNSEQAEAVMQAAAAIKFRAELMAYAKSFYDSFDLLMNVTAAKEYWIPAKRLGYLLFRIRNRYKDETMDLKWASDKVRKLIDKHIASLGVDTRVAEVSILSDEFSLAVSGMNKTARAKASEMEHAIRAHIKINLNKDPALYTRFKDRLDLILKTYAGNWEVIVDEQEKLLTELRQGRKEAIEGISAVEAPFYDLLLKAVPEAVQPQQTEATKKLTNEVVRLIRDVVQLNNTWDRGAELRKLEGSIEDELNYSRIEGIKDAYGPLTGELLKLARKRERELKEA